MATAIDGFQPHCVEMFKTNPLAVSGYRHGSPDHLMQFPEITGPRIRQEKIHDVVIKVLVPAPREITKRGVDEIRQILPVTKCGQAHRNATESKVQIFAEHAAPHQSRKILMRCTHDQYIDANLPGRTDPRNSPFLDHAQQTGLQ